MNKRKSLQVAGFIAALLLGIPLPGNAVTPTKEELANAHRWAERNFSRLTPEEPGLLVIANLSDVQKNNRNGKPMKLAGTDYNRGLYCHAPSKIVVRLPGPGAKFTAVIGVDSNSQTSGGRGSVDFTVHVGNAEKSRSGVLREGMPTRTVQVPLDGATGFVLQVEPTPDGIDCDQSDWAEAKVTLKDGREIWLADLALKKVGGEPFSFTYGGRKSSELLGTWTVEQSTPKSVGDVTERTITYFDPQTRLQVRCVVSEFSEFPAVEWVVYFKNTGTTNTPILADIQALDAGMSLPRDRNAVLHYAKGSQLQLDEFAPQWAYLGPHPDAPQAPWIGEGNPIQLRSKEGRSSAGMLPFFNVDAGTQGVIGAVGWTGVWAANIFRSDSEVRMRAGMPRTHLKLLPGEEIRSPRVALLFWQGDRMHGHNLWRQFVLAHHSPQVAGKPARVPVSLVTWGGNYATKHIAHGQWLKNNELPVDFLWVDAGWFGTDEVKVGANVFNSNWGALVGDWFPNPNYFPDGLGPVGQALKQMNLGFLLWLEPERVFNGTTWTREHPEFLLGPLGPNYLFNLGNPAAQRALTEHFVKLINDGNISCYRQDFNMDAQPYWDAADAPDRVGMTEIQHITGLYQMWDELLARCPGLLIDNCSSGGRRIDLETMSRSVPLWRSDVQCYPGFSGAAMQGQTHGLNLWVPLSAGACDQEDTYMFRSALGPGLDLMMYEFEKDNSKHFSLDWLRQRLAELNEVRDFFRGDFHPLLNYTLAEDSWAAWQFDRPDLGAGLVLAFRRPQSPFDGATLSLKGLEPAAKYEFRDPESGVRTLLSGKECMEKGLRVEFSKRPASRLLIYRKL